ncbi:MAG: NADH-quinone oxidoreductase subunit L [Candidatus Micrarchaeia archaeon]
MFAIIALLPLVVLTIAIALLREGSRYLKYVALAASVTPLLLVPWLLGSIGTMQSIRWLTVGTYTLHVTTMLLPLNLLLFTLVSIIAPLVVLYANGFMDKLSEDRRFYIEILTFQAAMLVFSIAGNFITLLIGWSFLSITSYLLIGFWNHKENAPGAARKAIITVIIGDLSILASAAIMFTTFSTLNFLAIISDIGGNFVASGPFYIAMVLLLVAVLTKSAQFPFQEWLADAMEGPTPVSAFLHSSTMVKAGTFMAIILFPLFVAAKLSSLMVLFGGVTIVIAISNALVNKNIKRVLAYSTMEELALILFALGVGAYAAAIYFFVMQTFYKALLFFYAGTVIKGNEESEDLENVRLYRGNRLLLAIGLIGTLSLAGFFPFNGFFANIMVESSLMSNTLAYAFMLLVDLGVSFFIIRWFVLPLRKVKNAAMLHKLSFSFAMLDKKMVYASTILAAITLAAPLGSIYIIGAIKGMNHYGYAAAVPSSELLDMVVEMLIVLAGIYFAYYLFYKKGRRIEKTYWLFNNSAAFNAFYRYFADFIYYLGGAAEFADILINEYFDKIGFKTAKLGGYIRNIETGSVSIYVIALIIGLALLIVGVLV